TLGRDGELRDGADTGIRVCVAGRRLRHSGLPRRGDARDGRPGAARRRAGARGGGRSAARGRAGPPVARGRRPRRSRGALFLGRDRESAARRLRPRHARRAGPSGAGAARGGHGMKELALSLGRNRWARLSLALAVFAGVFVALWFGPNWSTVGSAFQGVRWAWVAVAIAINLASIVSRSIAWKLVIDQALPRPSPRFRLVFSAFCVGLLANAVLPGRIGELARVAVLTRRMERRLRSWATLVGTVVAHRLFDL